MSAELAGIVENPSLLGPVLIGVAFLFGLGASALRLPAMVGFLLAGVALRAAGFESTETIKYAADLGVTLLMFTIGLKLQVKGLLRPVVWGGTSAHLAISCVGFVAAIMGLRSIGLAPFAGLDLEKALLLAFALSFSSTVFAVKTLEENSESASPHGRTAVGMLIMQDVFAVLFLSLSLGKEPSVYAILLLLLLPLRRVLLWVLERAGHGDLLVASGLFFGLFIGAFLFSLVGLKADLGALIVGALLANHPKAKELANVLLGFKEILLIAFFLHIGLSESLTQTGLIAALLLVLILPAKVLLYFVTITLFRHSSHRSFLSSLTLSNYSEFGLIVAAVGVELGWLDKAWLVVLALALTLSFIIAAPLNRVAHELEFKLRPWLQRFERSEVANLESIKLEGVDVILFGMGRIGTATYDELQRMYDTVLGVDFDPTSLEYHVQSGRRVILGDATDPAFWQRVTGLNGVEAVVLATPDMAAHCLVTELLKKRNYPGFTFAVAQHPEEVHDLFNKGATGVYLHHEAGVGLATHVHETLKRHCIPERLSARPSRFSELPPLPLLRKLKQENKE